MRCRTVVPSILAIVLMLFASPAFAQGSTPHQAGITVAGYGTATAPAERATIILALAESNYGPMTAPQPGATPGASERRAAAPAVHALVSAGIDEAGIEVVVGPSVQEIGSYGGPAVALLRFTVADNVSTDRISELVDAATVGAAEERLTVGQVGVRYEVADCSTLVRDARANAIDDARDRAALQAELLDVSIGPVTASHDVSPGSDLTSLYGAALAGGSCAPMDVSGRMYGTFYLPSFDPTADAEVSVDLQIELTFGMVSATATPES